MRPNQIASRTWPACRKLSFRCFSPTSRCDITCTSSQRLVGEKHLKLSLRHAGQVREAIWFGRIEPVGERVRLAYRLSVDQWQGRERVQMVIEAIDS